MPDRPRPVPTGRTPSPTRAAVAAVQGGEVTPAFLDGLRRGLARVERLGRGGPVTLLLLQNAPPQADPDAEALAAGTASRRAAVRHWRLGREAALDRVLRVNLLRRDPAAYADPVGTALERLGAALGMCGGRGVAAVVATGWLARDAATPRRRGGAAAWLRPAGAPAVDAPRPAPGGATVLAVPHPSGKCRLYNPARAGTDS
jgi:hypothetical protein